MPNPNDEHPRRKLYREAERATALGLTTNVALGVFKLTAGVLSSSFALLSDGINSIGDAFSSIVVLVSLRISQQPPDDEHPYGHTRAETIGACFVAQVIIFSGIFIAIEAIERLSLPQPDLPSWTLAVAAANVLIKEALFHRTARVAKRTNSSALLASAWDHRADALASLIVLLGIGLTLYAGPAYNAADEVAGLLVAAFIVRGAAGLLFNSVRELMDMQDNPQFLALIQAHAEQHPQVCAIEKTFVRKSGLEHFVDIHVQVPCEMTVDEAHTIGHEVKDILLEKHPSIRDVLVHIEPFPHPKHSNPP